MNKSVKEQLQAQIQAKIFETRDAQTAHEELSKQLQTDGPTLLPLPFSATPTLTEPCSLKQRTLPLRAGWGAKTTGINRRKIFSFAAALVFLMEETKEVRVTLLVP